MSFWNTHTKSILHIRSMCLSSNPAFNLLLFLIFQNLENAKVYIVVQIGFVMLHFLAAADLSADQGRREVPDLAGGAERSRKLLAKPGLWRLAEVSY